MDYLGAKFSGVGFHGGHSVKRAHHTANGSGSEVVGKMLSKARETGVNLQTRTKLVRLVRNGDGRVVGVEVRKGYRFPDAKPTATPPFYAARLWPKVHHTMGGLMTDLDGRVIGYDFNPVQGLYAVGELTGGVHGAVRLGGCAGIECIVNGRIAGRKAAAETPWS